MTKSYAMICSSGRSGSNWLLDILDLSAWTLSRSEPDEAASELAFARILSAKELVGHGDDLLESMWDEVVAEASMSLGPRDHVMPRHKRYVRTWAKWSGADLLMRKHRLRRGLSLILPSIRGDEWRLPGWLVDQAYLAASVPIFKINNAPGWGVWALRHRPEARIVHLVRHPSGFLNSWVKRYLNANDSQQVLQANRARLQSVANVDATWGRLFGDIEAMPLEETELWYWRYANESLYVEGKGRESYLMIPFEQLAHEPLESAKQAFGFCGLTWSDQIERHVVEMSRRSPQIAKAWQSHLSAEQIAIVERVLDGSPLAEAWPQETPTSHRGE